MRGSIVGLVLIASWPAAAQLPYQEPGPFPVGVTVVELVKPSVTTGQPRALSTQVWYPATPGTGTPEGAFLRGAEVAKGRFPLVVFSHGSCGIPNQSVFLMEALASRGFIMAA